MKSYIQGKVAAIAAIKDEVKNTLTGKRVRIISEHYNGQPYGRSRKCLKGHEDKIVSVVIDSEHCWVWVEKYRDCAGLRLDEVEFLDEY